MAKLCGKIIVIISFLVPENQILVMSPKIAYNSVTDEFSIIVTPYAIFWQFFFLLLLLDISHDFESKRCKYSMMIFFKITLDLPLVGGVHLRFTTP